MKKLLFPSILVFILSGNLFAQTDPARVEQDYIFQYINKSLIPSGYLDEYGPQVVDKNWLNGVLTDSNLVELHFTHRDDTLVCYYKCT